MLKIQVFWDVIQMGVLPLSLWYISLKIVKYLYALL